MQATTATIYAVSIHDVRVRPLGCFAELPRASYEPVEGHTGAR